MIKNQKGQAHQEKTGCRLQRLRLLQRAAITKVFQIVIFCFLATQHSSQRRTITVVDKDQLSRAPKSGRCNNDGNASGHDKCHHFHISSVRCINMDLYKDKGSLDQQTRYETIKDMGTLQ